MGAARLLEKTQTRAIIGTALAGVLTLTLAAPAFALDRPSEPNDGAPGTRSSATSFTPDLQTEIEIGEASRPSDFVASPDGTTGYVVGDELSEFVVIDMASREVVQRIPLPSIGAGYIRLSTDGTRAYFALQEEYFSTGIGAIDLTTGTLLPEFAAAPDHIQEIAVSRDGNSVFVLGLNGLLLKLDAYSGEELARVQLQGSNAHALALIQDDSKILVGRESHVLTLAADTLELLEDVTLPGINSVGTLRVDGTDERVYFADSSGTRLGTFNPVSDEIIAQASVGSPMHEVIGFDTLDRAFGNVPYWDLLMAADLTSGKRSESFRATPTAPFSINKNPVTGELLSANGGWSNAEKGSTVTIVNTPSVADPSDVHITDPGELVRFETNAVGIKRGNGGGVMWQSSADGETWTDIEGAVDEQLEVVATAAAVEQQYRVRWRDDFWGQSGTSAAARITTPAPQITFEGPLADGIVGEAYPDTVITATGYSDLNWAVRDAEALTALPAGMRIDAASGTLHGTPTAAGSFTFTVEVTDAFGTDMRDYTLVVSEADEPTGPTDPTGPTGPTDPTGPTLPSTPGDGTDSPSPAQPKDPAAQASGAEGHTAAATLSQTGAGTPLFAALIAAGAIALGSAGVFFARRRSTASEAGRGRRER
ncbi:putative Ig domain-containing protein [Leucobacter luti]|uniref:putative Ig domain-containing protein n=1 Tax=Leucobacter luti TaxID=340320 RepID=UPI001C68A938|nr:putative Ig domain-containing protein [Leucobacter luti]QYM76690.1 putative Ig domain-containing protein [Leucobacter luti]